jgi:uncharacterized protein (DUF305 family)
MKRLILAVALVLLTGSCGSAENAPSTPPSIAGYFNDTDVMFLQMMVAHHGPADEMLRIAAARAKREEVKNLAAAVRVTQADETRMMSEWLQSWGQSLISSAPPDAHAAHGGALPKGEAEIASLNAAADGGFDHAFLSVFIGYQHHAVSLAQMEIRGGANVRALELANRVEKNRRAQIELMLRYAS